MSRENLRTASARQALPPIIRNRINVLAHRLAIEWEDGLRRRLLDLATASAATGRPIEQIRADVEEFAAEKLNGGKGS